MGYFHESSNVIITESRNNACFIMILHCILSLCYKNLPMQYTEISELLKIEIFSTENFLYFSYFYSKHRLWIQVRTASPKPF